MLHQQKIRQLILDKGMRVEDLDSDPFFQFNVWLEQAKDAGIRYPNAMTLATVDSRGVPFQRMVMLRQLDYKGLVFYTSLGSRKSEQLAQNANASVLFPWHMLERQVQISGVAEPLSKREVMKFFSLRPKSTQLATWLSQQSSPVSSRGLLESKLKEIKARFAEGDISIPPFWGGYRIVPDSFEFWQTGQDHVNDRFMYRCVDGLWRLDRIAP